MEEHDILVCRPPLAELGELPDLPPERQPSQDEDDAAGDLIAEVVGPDPKEERAIQQYRGELIGKRGHLKAATKRAKGKK